jgi:hypothetical protein
MGRSKPDNSAAVVANQQAAQQAQLAQQQEAARQARITQGYNAIQNIFSGTPVMGTRDQAFDWSTATPGSSALPSGYSWTQVKDPASQAASYGFLSGRAGGSPTPNTPASWRVTGPGGQTYSQGQAFSAPTQYDTGQRTGGFTDDFYNGIAKNITDLGNVDINQQYNKARENLMYALSRQGLSQSGAGNQGAADIETAKTKAQGDLGIQAQAAVGQVKDNVATQKAAAEQNLYATEDPTEAADTATSKFASISANKPTYNPMGDIFNNIIGGFGGAYSAAKNAGYLGPTSVASNTPKANPAGGVG